VVVPEAKDSLQEAFTRAVSGSPWWHLRHGHRAALAVAVAGAAAVVLMLLGVAAAASHDGSPPALVEGPPRATAAVTGPASVPPQAQPPARPVPHAEPGPTAPVAGEGAALPGPPPGDPPPEVPPPPEPAEPPAREQPVTVTSMPLAMGGGLTATLYVGQLDHLLRRLDGTVTFNTDSAFRAQRPRLCVATVVIEGVSGGQAAVYARGLGSGWGGAEDVPDLRVAADRGTVHQQLVIPPPAAPAGTSWTGSAALHVDGELVGVSGEYRLTVEAVDGPVWQWRAGNDRTPVECRVD
jgi:hypothetical protein